MPSVMQLLDRFNRKERYFLVGFALGNPGFRPHPEFLKQLGNAVDLTFPHDPDDIRCWMDYHLDWLYASLVLSDPASAAIKQFPSPAFPTVDEGVVWNVNANQEDVDLLLAFEDGATTHLVMLEAKGETGWLSAQLLSKARRLKRIFDVGEKGLGLGEARGVTPHFAIASPMAPTVLNKKLDEHPGEVPTWMRPKGTLPWMPLNIPSDRLQIERCDETGAAQSGLSWRLKPPMTVW